MRVDLKYVEQVADDLELGDAMSPTPSSPEPAIEVLRDCATRLRELLSALGEVRRSKTHQSAVEAAQRALSGEPPEHIWTPEELAAGEREDNDAQA